MPAIKYEMKNGIIKVKDIYYVHFYVTTQNVPEGCDTCFKPTHVWLNVYFADTFDWPITQLRDLIIIIIYPVVTSGVFKTEADFSLLSTHADVIQLHSRSLQNGPP